MDIARPARILFLALGALALAAPGIARGAEGRISEIGVLVGAGLSDGDLQGGPTGFGSIGPVYGVRGAWPVAHRLLWFGDLTVGNFPTDLTSGDAERVAIRTGVDFLLGSSTTRAWFVSGAGGWGQLDFEKESLDFDRPLVSAGFGRRIQMRNTVLFRWEVRVEALLGNSGLGGDGVQNGELLVGWALPIGRGTRDADGDGVSDRHDRCAFTPLGAKVDERGCAIDSDGDLVPDGVDQCPDTPAHARVDAVGCPKDSDGDGVLDGIDVCPATAPGTKVDARGCVPR